MDVLCARESVFQGQSVHSAMPDAALWVPLGHAIHVSPSAPVKPALQRQAFRSVLAICEIELSGHALHSSGPVVFLYVFLAHGVQILTGSEADADVPAAHLFGQTFTDVPGCKEVTLCGHA